MIAISDNRLLWSSVLMVTTQWWFEGSKNNVTQVASNKSEEEAYLQ